jgi:hypothetical protein
VRCGAALDGRRLASKLSRPWERRPRRDAASSRWEAGAQTCAACRCGRDVQPLWPSVSRRGRRSHRPHWVRLRYGANQLTGLPPGAEVQRSGRGKVAGVVKLELRDQGTWAVKVLAAWPGRMLVPAACGCGGRIDTLGSVLPARPKAAVWLVRRPEPFPWSAPRLEPVVAGAPVPRPGPAVADGPVPGPPACPGGFFPLVPGPPAGPGGLPGPWDCRVW